MNKKLELIVIVLFPLLYGCVSLHEINEYANTSKLALDKVNEVDYTFSDYCVQDCDLQQMRLGKIDTLFKCNCHYPGVKADEAIQMMYTTISAYLTAVEQLSNNKAFTYDVSDLTKGLQQNPLLHLSDEQVSNYTRAANFISTAATAVYRQRKLSEYIGKADPFFQNLTEAFIYLIDNGLRVQLKLGHEAKLANIRQMLSNSKEDKGMKQFIMRWYLDENNYYKKRDSLLGGYASLLPLIQKGHHELYLHRNNLKAYETRELIKHYQLDLQDLITTLKK